MGQKDYEELEGKEVVVLHDDEESDGIVAGVNFDIGLTIEKKDSKGSDRFVCLHGPSYKPTSGRSNYVQKSYKTEFYTAVSMIKKGKVDLPTLSRVEMLKAGFNFDSPMGTVGTCSFT